MKADKAREISKLKSDKYDNQGSDFFNEEKENIINHIEEAVLDSAVAGLNYCFIDGYKVIEGYSETYKELNINHQMRAKTLVPRFVERHFLSKGYIVGIIIPNIISIKW